MAYLFGAGNTDVINCGTGVTKAGTWSIAVRVRVTQAISANRILATVRDVSLGVTAQLYFGAGASNNIAQLLFSSGGVTAFPNVTWVSGFTAGSLHTLVGVFSGASLVIYADTDDVQKAAISDGTTPDQPAGASLCIGNEPGGSTNSADSTIYEVGWYPGVVLSGRDAAQFGAGFDLMCLRPRPANHYRLVRTGRDNIGSQHGTVTGATVVPHTARIYYPRREQAATRFTVAPAAPTNIEPGRTAWRGTWRGAFRGA